MYSILYTWRRVSDTWTRNVVIIEYLLYPACIHFPRKILFFFADKFNYLFDSNTDNNDHSCSLIHASMVNNNF